jgi:hypothetical protein
VGESTLARPLPPRKIIALLGSQRSSVWARVPQATKALLRQKRKLEQEEAPVWSALVV